MIHTYALTNGIDVYETRKMSFGELIKARRDADNDSDGRLWWEMVPDISDKCCCLEHAGDNPDCKIHYDLPS